MQCPSDARNTLPEGIPHHKLKVNNSHQEDRSDIWHVQQEDMLEQANPFVSIKKANPAQYYRQQGPISVREMN
eukprot:c15967_g1_i1 orf=187-405(-)